MGFHVLGQPTPMTTYLLDKLCTKLAFLCLDMTSLVATNEAELSGTDRFTAFMGHYPSGGSLNVIFHFLQMIRADAVTVGFDYRDEEKNIARYGSATVPTISMDALNEL